MLSASTSVFLYSVYVLSVRKECVVNDQHRIVGHPSKGR
jgi:hypothetical protein